MKDWPCSRRPFLTILSLPTAEGLRFGRNGKVNEPATVRRDEPNQTVANRARSLGFNHHPPPPDPKTIIDWNLHERSLPWDEGWERIVGEGKGKVVGSVRSFVTTVSSPFTSPSSPVPFTTPVGAANGRWTGTGRERMVRWGYEPWKGRWKLCQGWSLLPRLFPCHPLNYHLSHLTGRE